MTSSNPIPPLPLSGLSPAARPGTRLRAGLAVLAIWTAVGLLAAGLPLLFTPDYRGQPLRPPAVLFQLGVWYYWALATPLVVWLDRRWKLPGALPLHLVAGLLLALGHAVAVAALGRWLFAAGPAPYRFAPAVRSWLGSRLVIDLLVYGLIVGGVLAVESARRLREAALRQAELRAELVRAELATLRMQLRPHFLFNALHTVGVLIEEDPEAAGRMVVALGDLLRASVHGAPDQMVPLAEERAITERYLSIETIRFQDRLRVVIEIPPETEAVRVPPLLLQPLIENALRHGLGRLPEGGLLRVAARREGDRLVLEVDNDGPPVTPGAADGLGLTMTRGRLQHLYGGRATVELATRAVGHGALARITLPWTT